MNTIFIPLPAQSFMQSGFVAVRIPSRVWRLAKQKRRAGFIFKGMSLERVVQGKRGNRHWKNHF
jgi:hypothetical protein